MQDYTQAWKDQANSKTLTSYDMFNLCLMKAIKSKSNTNKVKLAWAILQKTFSPVTNSMKLANGHDRWAAIARAAYYAKYAKQENWLLSHLNEYEFGVFKELAADIHMSIWTNDVPEKQYSFFFVRQDISPEYQLVQNSHVALKLGVEMAKEEVESDDLYFACIGTENLDSLMEIYTDLLNRGIRTVPFYEPDLRNELTAIGTFPISASEKGFLKNHKKLTFNINK